MFIHAIRSILAHRFLVHESGVCMTALLFFLWGLTFMLRMVKDWHCIACRGVYAAFLTFLTERWDGTGNNVLVMHAGMCLLYACSRVCMCLEMVGVCCFIFYILLFFLFLYFGKWRWGSETFDDTACRVLQFTLFSRSWAAGCGILRDFFPLITLGGGFCGAWP